MKKILTLLLLIGLRTQAQDYTQTVRGTVKDKESQAMLGNLQVSITTAANTPTTSTDKMGVFKLEKIPVGRHTIRVSLTGYKEAIIPDLIVNSAKEVVLNIELEEEVKSLEGVKIKSNKTNNEMITVSGRVFTTDQTNRFAGSLGDPSRMASNFAGVNGVGGQRNDIVIRGNSPMGLLWRLEGVDIPNPNHFSSQGTTGGPIAILNNNNLASSDFMTGAFPAEYGNCLSGVFDLKMRNGNNEKREYTGQVGFNGFEFGAEGPINKKKGSSYLANYRYSTLGVFDALGVNLTFGGIPKYQDINFKMHFPNTKTGTWQLTGIGGMSNIALLDSKKDSADLNFNQSFKNDIYTSNNMAAVVLSNLYKIKKSGYVKTMLSYSYLRRYIHQDSLGPKNEKNMTYAEKSIYTRLVLHSFYHHKLNAMNSIRAGAILSNVGADIQDSFLNNNGKMQTLRQFDGNNFLGQAYVEWKHNFAANLVMNNGIYYQHWSLNTNSKSIEPRAGLKYNLSNTKALSFGYGLHSQLQPLEIYYSQRLNTSGQYYQSNKGLGFSKAHHYVLGYDWLINKTIRLKVETYYQSLFGIPISETLRNPYFSLINFGADFAGLPNLDSLVNKGKGRNYGLEFTLEKLFSKGYYYLLTASFFESKFTPQNGTEYNTAFNGNYVVNALGGYELKCGHKKNNVFSINLKGTAAGGRRYTPIDLPASIQAGEVRFKMDSLYTAQFKQYFRADIRIGFKLNGKRVTQEWAIDIQNAFNIKNPLQPSFDSKTGKIKIENQQGILPIALYRIQF